MRLNKQLAVAAILTSMMSVQGGASIAKYLFHLVGPAGAVSLRLGLAGLIMAVAVRPPFPRFNRKEWLCALFYGLSVGIMNLTFYYGIQRVPLGIGVTVEFIGPLGLALICSRKSSDFLWAFLAALGIVLIVPWKSGGSVDPLGLLFVFVAGIMWALYIVSAGRITRQMKSTHAVSAGLIIASFLVVPFGLASGDLADLDGHMLLLGLGVAIFSSVLPFSLDMQTMKVLPSKTFSVMQSLQPAFGALSGLLFLNERLSLIQCLAIACVVAASAGSAACSDRR